MARYEIDWSSRPGSNMIDLGQEGLSDGGDLTPYVADFFEPGNQVYIPPGEYVFDSNALGVGDTADVALVGDPEGVICNRPSGQTRPNFHPAGGDVLIENITFRGQKGEQQSRWRCDPHGGGRLTLRNVNWPDGTVDPSDSQVLNCESTGSGTIRLENCFIGPHGNSTIYVENATGNVHIETIGCTFENVQNAIRPNEGGLTVRDCQFFLDGHVPRFHDTDTGNISGPYGRLIRWKNISASNAQIEDLHVIMTADCNAPGPSMDNKIGSDLSGFVDGFYLYNETDRASVAGAGVLSGSDIHVSGPGNKSVPWAVDGSQAPDDSKTVWKPVRDGGCASAADCPRNLVCENGECVGPVIAVDGNTDLDVLSAEYSAKTSLRQAHEGYTGPGFIDLESREGGFAIWTLDVQRPGDYELEIRFSNGSGNSRTADLILGSGVDQVTFPDTGGWSQWDTMTVEVSLPEGPMEFGFETTGEDAGHIDTASLLVVDPCEGVECGPGEECMDGECVVVDPCATVNCGSCETCEDGDCVPVADPCCGVSCGHGLVCIDGECVQDPDNPCAIVECGDCLVCEDGQCVAVDDPCCGINCADGEVCEEGECVSPGDGGFFDSGTLGLLALLLVFAAGLLLSGSDENGE